MSDDIRKWLDTLSADSPDQWADAVHQINEAFIWGRREDYLPFAQELATLLTHPSEAVVELAVYLLGELKVQEAIPQLIVIVRQRDHTANEEASTALRNMGWQAVEPLKELLDDPDPWVQNKAVLLLGFIGTLPAFHAIHQWESRKA